MLGHFRHESGHYYWDRLVQNTDWLTPYRELFGDERADYQAALKTHYEQPVSDWQQHFISQYASAHPWEDWAETWAHYLHMTDTLNAALDFGIQPGSLAMHVEPFDSSQLPPLPLGQDEREAFLDFCNRWVQLSSVLNVLARSMGQTDIYPFVLNVDSLRKLYLVHALIADSSTRSRAE
ncbi:putative zinc-binding metallopeptidase [Halopseudomonas pachastrellae]|nr:putative zinc-binding metallopeptidase [Halopseudomonas pachastrellae]